MLNPANWQLYKDPDGTIQLVSRLIRENAREYTKRYILAFVFMGLVAASTAASVWILKDVINEVFVNKDSQAVYVIAITVMVIFAVKGSAAYGQMVVLGRIGNAIVAKLQSKLFARLLQQDISYFDKTSFGDIAVRIGRGAGDTRSVIDLVVTALGRDVLTVLALVVVMIIQDPLLSLIALVVMPPAVLGVGTLIKRVKKYAKKQFVSNTEIMSVLQETIRGIRVVKAFGVQETIGARMNNAVSDVEQQSNKIVSLTARTSPLMDTLAGFAIALVILYGGYSVVQRGQDPGAFFSFIAALLMAYDPARRLARLQVNLNNSLVGVRLMYELVDDVPKLQEVPNAPDLVVTKGEIEFEDVHFAYGESAALNGLSLTAVGGKTAALVGASGAGKSTLFSLIERFYDPLKGRLLIDGQDISKVSIRSLRQNIAMVTQDTFLFDGSLRVNIAVGRPDASEEEIVQAARDANAHDFIMELPGGYDALAGEGGGNLSGGQRQRIAIARAMLRNAPILLLDEATSALDAESEAKVQSALARLMTGRTTLVIAHRLSTVRDADEIHVMDKGRRIESGTHMSLFAADGVYRRLCELQFQNGEKKAS
ncbi:ABC transporter ATP-binding protein [Roseibium sp.]|uniref:ABC transporter ATP-binding protein n=1 Tax=Roseibium sp. TaxID=1936156 RepID=UPI003A985881